MKIVVVDKSSLNVVHRYEDSAPNQSKFGGPWGSPDMTVHLECEELDWFTVKGEMDGDDIILVVDEDLVSAREEQLWLELRHKRDILLTNCDWTQLPDSPLNSQDKTSWQEYRQELRDLPENTEDPANPEWPTPPDVEI